MNYGVRLPHQKQALPIQRRRRVTFMSPGFFYQSWDLLPSSWEWHYSFGSTFQPIEVTGAASCRGREVLLTGPRK